MRQRLLLLSLALAIALPVLPAGTVAVATVERMCGKLATGKEMPRSDDATFVPHSTVRLYSRTAGEDCCPSSPPSAEAITNRSGSFRFKKMKPGDYWLVAKIDGAEYRLPIRYQPDRKTEADCSSYWYVLRAGELHFENYVTVTVSQE